LKRVPHQRDSKIGEFIREQRRSSKLSLRGLAAMANVSDSYLSQVERGLYRPSADIALSIAKALNLSADSFFDRLGLLDESDSRQSPIASVPDAINADRRLRPDQKAALTEMYRVLVARP
jgi:transcriptional regulator with XRE-family HTH domain